MISLQDLPPEVLDGEATPAVAVPVAMAPVTVAPTAPMLSSPPLDSAEVAPFVPAAVLPNAPAVDSAPTAASASAGAWELGLQAEAQALLMAGRTDVWDVLTQRVESQLIRTALGFTRGRRIEAAQKLGIGRNTITRKIQELGLE